MGYKTVALVSGGKDSCYNMIECTKNGHEIVALANLHPPNEETEEMDSFMYQTVGSKMVNAIADCMELPLFRRPIIGKALNQGLEYESSEGDEVEDLLRLLQDVKEQVPGIEAVSCGAILSTYQRNRVEDVCSRLGLVSLAYMWQRDQREVLHEMIDNGIEAILVKIASMGLKTSMLGQSLARLTTKFDDLYDEFGFHVCGEGGEYETITLDMPLFKKRIVVDRVEVVLHDDVPFAPVAFLKILDFHLEVKSQPENPLNDSSIKTPYLPKEPIVSPLVHVSDYYIQKRRSISCGPFVLTKALISPECSTCPIEEEVISVMEKLERTLSSKGSSLDEVLFVHLFVSDMSLFGAINSVYCKFFKSCPPSRACVQVCMNNARVMVDAVAYRSRKNVLHVRSISKWAPVCIGPYAQANSIDSGVSWIAGQISLQPESMKMTGDSILDELRLSFQHASRILDCVGSCLSSKCLMSVIVYLSTDDPAAFEEAENYVCEAVSKRVPVSICIVPVLPRNAAVEVEVVALQQRVVNDHQIERRTKIESCCSPGHVEITECLVDDYVSSSVLHLTLNLPSSQGGNLSNDNRLLAKSIISHFDDSESCKVMQLRVFFDASSASAISIVGHMLALGESNETDKKCIISEQIPPGHTEFSWIGKDLKSAGEMRNLIGHTKFSSFGGITKKIRPKTKLIILPVPVVSLINNRILSIVGTGFPVIRRDDDKTT